MLANRLNNFLKTRNIHYGWMMSFLVFKKLFRRLANTNIKAIWMALFYSWLKEF